MTVGTGVALIVAETQTLCKRETREKSEKIGRRGAEKRLLFRKRRLWTNFFSEKSDIFKVDRGCYNNPYNGTM